MQFSLDTLSLQLVGTYLYIFQNLIILDKKNQKDEIKKASKKVLVDMCIQLFDQKYGKFK